MANFSQHRTQLAINDFINDLPKNKIDDIYSDNELMIAKDQIEERLK